MSLNVIRGFLGVSQLQSPELRLEDGVVQRTYDGGTTWVDSPLDDPRTNPAGVRERTTVSTTRCDAAARMIHALHDEFDTFIAAANALEFAVNLMGILVAIVGTGLTGGIAILFDIVLGGGYALFTIGQSTLSAAFTSTVWDNLVCTLYCFVEADGTITRAGVDAFYAKVQAGYSSTVYNALIELGNLLGWVLLSDAYLEYGDTGSCGGCTACTWQIQLSPSSMGDFSYAFRAGTFCQVSAWYPVPVAGGVSSGIWQATSVSGTQHLGFTIRVRLPVGCTVTQVTAAFGRNGNNNWGSIWLDGAGLYCALNPNCVSFPGCGTGVGTVKVGDDAEHEFHFRADSNTNGVIGTIGYVVLTGTGLPPRAV